MYSENEITKASFKVALQESKLLSDELFNLDRDLHHKSLIVYYSIENAVNNLISLKDNVIHVNDFHHEQRELISCKQSEIESVSLVNKELRKRISDLKDVVASQYKIMVIKDDSINELKNKLITISQENHKFKYSKKENLDSKLNEKISMEKERSKKLIEKERNKSEKYKIRIASLEKECNELIKRERKNSDSIPIQNNRFPGKSQNVEFFVHEYKSQLQVQLHSNDFVKPLKNLDWHLQVMRNNGVSIAVTPTVWLMPVLPEFEHFSSEWNPKITVRLHQYFLERAREMQLPEYEYTMAAKQFVITTNMSLSEHEQGILKKCKLISLFDVVSLTYSAFEKTVFKYNKKILNSECTDLRIKIEEISEGLISKIMSAKG